MAVLAAFVLPHPPLILAEIGRGQEKTIQKTIDAFEETARRIANLKPDTIVLTSPHAVLYGDYFHLSPGEVAQGDLRRFGAKEASVDVQYDTEFVGALADAARRRGLPAGTKGEREIALDHATIIPLIFVNHATTAYRLVRTALSGLPAADHFRFGQCISQTAEALGRRTVFIASGDLSHRLKKDGPYGFAPEGPKFDETVIEALKAGDVDSLLHLDPNMCEAAGECGLRALWVMAGVLHGKTHASEVLSYEGPFGVGYGVAAFEVKENAANHVNAALERSEFPARTLSDGTDPYVSLAKYSLETYIKTGKTPELPTGLPKDMTKRQAGVFVSIKQRGRLRGCIGTILPTTESIAKEILRNAVSSGVEDPRFPPVKEFELPTLVYSVDVLGDPEPIDSPEHLDVRRYGVIVSKGSRRGLLLPNLEGVDTVEEQIAIAKQKAGISPYESCRLERFEVVRHK